MKIKLINFGGLVPSRAHYNDAGADVFAKKREVLFINETKAIPLGIGLELPDGYMAVVYNKSGLSSKGFLNSNAPIDSGYRGEIHAIVTNTTGIKQIIQAGTKIGQLVVTPITIPEFVVETEPQKSRGVNAFGSTGE